MTFMPLDYWILIGGFSILILAARLVYLAKKNDVLKKTDDQGDHRDDWPYMG
jgi:hypothetical protein